MREPSGRRRGRFAIIAALTLSLTAAACSDKKSDDSSPPAGGGDTTEAPDTGDTGNGDTGNGDTETTDPPPPVVTEPPASEFAAVFGGKIVVGGEAETANPWTPAAMNCDSFCQMRARTFYDPLVVIDDELQVQPYLAESVVANDDSTEFTITLRQGILFHDGTEFNADVAMDNINRSFTSLLIGAAVKDVAKEDGAIKFEKIDEYTFKMFTGLDGDPAAPVSWPLFPYYLGGQGGLMASSEWLAAVDGGADPTQAVGTGPFLLDSYAPGDKLIVKRNPDYWVSDENGDQLPYLDEIEFRVIPDSQVRAEALKSGDVDMISTSDSLVVGTLAEDSRFNYVNQEQFGETNYIMFNLTKPFLADQGVRCALSQAIDKEDLLAVVTSGYGILSNQMFTVGQEGYLSGDNGAPSYDPDAAEAVIAEWEAANGPLTINYSTTPTASNLATANFLADAWGSIGVDVVIDQIEQSKLINNALFGDPAFDAFGWRNHAGLFVDQQFFWWHSSAAADPGDLALNFGRLRDPEIDELLTLSRSEADADVRRGYAEDINRRFAEQCFTIPTSSTRWGVFSQQDVQNIGRSPLPNGDGFMRDGAGFSGQVWLTAVFLAN